MKLGGAELFVIVLVAFFVLGPDRTVLYARKAGKWLRVLKTYLSSMTEDLKETVVEPLEEMQEAVQEPLKEIWQPAGQLVQEVNASADSISRSMRETPRDPEAAPEKPAEDGGLEMAEFVDSVS